MKVYTYRELKNEKFNSLDPDDDWSEHYEELARMQRTQYMARHGKKMSWLLRLLDWALGGRVSDYINTQEYADTLMKQRYAAHGMENEAGRMALNLYTENQAQAALIRELREKLDDPVGYEESTMYWKSRATELSNDLRRIKKESDGWKNCYEKLHNAWDECVQKVGTRPDA